MITYKLTLKKQCRDREHKQAQCRISHCYEKVRQKERFDEEKKRAELENQEANLVETGDTGWWCNNMGNLLIGVKEERLVKLLYSLFVR